MPKKCKGRGPGIQCKFAWKAPGNRARAHNGSTCAMCDPVKLRALLDTPRVLVPMLKSWAMDADVLAEAFERINDVAPDCVRMYRRYVYGVCEGTDEMDCIFSPMEPGRPHPIDPKHHRLCQWCDQSRLRASVQETFSMKADSLEHTGRGVSWPLVRFFNLNANVYEAALAQIEKLPYPTAALRARVTLGYWACNGTQGAPCIFHESAEAQPATADPGASCKWCVATDALADAMLKPEEREKYMRDLDEWEQRNSHKYEAALSRLPAVVQKEREKTFRIKQQLGQCRAEIARQSEAIMKEYDEAIKAIETGRRQLLRKLMEKHPAEIEKTPLSPRRQVFRELFEEHPAEIEKTPPSPEVHELQSKIRQCEDEQNSYRRAKQARIARVQADGQDMETIIKNQIDAGQDDEVVARNVHKTNMATLVYRSGKRLLVPTQAF